MFRNSIIFKALLGLILLGGASPAGALAAGGKTVTWYLDGAKVEQELPVENSYRELLLPPTMRPGSFRARPLVGCRLARVELEPVKPGKSDEKELARLDERREELRDRLKALGVKEEIFKATAKSQGSKAPKRTRTNPEPLTAIRQGTDYAISRLEEVYRARRKVERDLKELDRKVVALKKSEKVSGTVARIWIEGRRGKVGISYITGDRGWTPYYDVRIAGDAADVTMMARVPDSAGADTVQLVAAGISGAGSSVPLAVRPGNPARVNSVRLPVTAVKPMPDLQKSVAVTITNSTDRFLPPGDAAGFWQEEFLGHSSFAGLKPGESCLLTFGAVGEPRSDIKQSE
ncbi:hypothetical protein OR1_00398 [Geobacter sp. OR-1]|uniref:hypothetical protein n=1 Tax=Geobacter sp. OR-1 TaxID=1266765 RepID=UPI000542CB43|nr:hypothetical protein [Geobacter sp. OR-1]GAM08127.1 hypothetical protein OR1_00398 [Geobacter sp. OR-1]